MAAYVIKRDGSSVPFDSSKILNAVTSAALASGEAIPSAGLLALTTNVCEKLAKGHIDHVEAIQDVVEEALIASGHAATAKAYILYRAEHAKIRQAGGYLMEIYKKLTYSDASTEDIKRENANINGDTPMGTMLKYGSEGSKFFIDNYVLPREISAAHSSGAIHIHDKDFYMLTETCCQIDLVRLFAGGFHTGHGYVREPQSIESYAALACIAVQSNQNEMHGGQSVPNFDWVMAEGVRKTWKKEYVEAMRNWLQITSGHEHAFPRIPAKLPDIDAPNRLPQSMLDAMRDFPELEKAHAYAVEKATQRTEQRTYQAMEALIHNLNTMHSRAGAQVPFSSLNYGTDTSRAGRMAIRNLLAATRAGLGDSETSIFPVQIFKVKAGINFNPGDPNYDLFKQAIETSARRLFPNFSFLDAPFNLQYYREGDYNTEVAYMGCRTRVMGNIYDKCHEVTCGRGNLSFTTVNLPRIAIEANGSSDIFFKILNERLDLVFRQLLHRLKIQSAKKARNYPFLMGNGIWLDSGRLTPDESIGEVLKHGTLTVGFIGLAETLVMLTGEHHGQSENARSLGLEIIGHMRESTDAQAKKTGLNFSLIATPAEGLAGRFVKIDRAQFGAIAGVTDREYYTNSFHVPVYFPISAHRKIEIEAPYHALTNAGHITYVELDGDMAHNPQAFEKIIRYMQARGIGYGSINHPVDRDPLCGYTGIIRDVCPRCGRREGEGLTRNQLHKLAKRFPAEMALAKYR